MHDPFGAHTRRTAALILLFSFMECRTTTTSIDHGFIIITEIVRPTILKLTLIGTENPLHFIFQARSAGS